jgi:2-keto-4-pentenoate hydratase/2-oxohepta-3-ene-1,7-dioic acid hydratase in catechol pathway
MAARALLALLWLLTGQAAALAQATEGDDAPLRFGRFEAEGQVRHGFLSVGGLHEIDRSYFAPGAVTTGRVFPVESVRLVSPVDPRRVIGVERRDGAAANAGPIVFAKLPSAVVGDRAAVIVPKGEAIEAEAEIAVVIARTARNVSEADALSHVAGVTAALDVSLAGTGSPPHLEATARDTFAPLGPFIVPGLYYDRLKMTASVNGKAVQTGAGGRMIEPVAALVSRMSRLFTLEPGDVILTGTPGGRFALKAGDQVELALEGVGTLTVTVRNE